MVTYGLCQHHVTNARLMVKTGRLNHEESMRLLKVVYRRRKRIHDSLHAEDKKYLP
ncbi:hypothetical protein [Escherichia phage Mt1B1_P3]|uniref:Uncharacterized protein n=1 Tax=Escherichia phage Mt1B1_P3 TaxID=2743962 RepID=A0A7G8L173_9CAUD|nr:hypothetical protein [Escherichia phage Mt1B1_P3]UAW58390.1 hypothetical protein ASO2B_004 [Escherichia phage vB_EcoA_ASO2B]